MALTDEVTARYPASRIIQLTNPGVQSADTVNATVYAAAATDTEADFPIYAGVAYDGTVARHVSVAVEGVIAYLYMRGESPGSDANARFDRYMERLRDLAKVEGRDRLKPKTKEMAKVTRPTERTTASFDEDTFDDIVPNSPI